MARINKKQITAFVEKSLKESCEMLRQYASTHHDFESKTGRLERAIKFRTAKQLNEIVLYVDEQEVPYAKYVMLGTGLWGRKRRRYEIRPKNKEALAFFWNRIGSFVRFKKVMHTGSPPDNFLQEALDDNMPRIKEIFERSLKRLQWRGGR